MFGQLLWLCVIVWMARAGARGQPEPEPSADETTDLNERSGLSGILILLSLGAVLLSPLVWFMPAAAAWKSAAPSATAGARAPCWPCSIAR